MCEWNIFNDKYLFTYLKTFLSAMACSELRGCSTFLRREISVCETLSFMALTADCAKDFPPKMELLTLNKFKINDYDESILNSLTHIFSTESKLIVHSPNLKVLSSYSSNIAVSCPKNLCLNYLEEVYISGGLTCLPPECPSLKVLVVLKRSNFFYSPQWTNIKVLNICTISEFILPPEYVNTKFLNINFCGTFEISIPNEWKKLETLHAFGTRLVSCKSSKKLKTLVLARASVNLKESFGSFQKLSFLDITFSDIDIQGIRFPKLKKLVMSQNSVDLFLNGVDFQNLEYLDAHNSNLTSLDGKFKKLKFLNISGCSKLINMDPISAKNVQTLHITGSMLNQPPAPALVSLTINRPVIEVHPQYAKQVQNLTILGALDSLPLNMKKLTKFSMPRESMTNYIEYILNLKYWCTQKDIFQSTGGVCVNYNINNCWKMQTDAFTKITTELSDFNLR